MSTSGFYLRGARALDMALHNGHEEVVFQLIRAGYTWGLKEQELTGYDESITSREQVLVGTRGPVMGQSRAQGLYTVFGFRCPS